ncbi:MAG: hypothetical protein GY701_29690 [Sulfitobacter sp.]|nr:hypothetical protein [Sulfitobacter sp.]
MMNKFLFAFLDRYRVSPFGLSLGLLFFAASLTPSMIPRSPILQGALGGSLMAVGYLTGVILVGSWRFLASFDTRVTGRTMVSLLLGLGGLAVLTVALVGWRDGQNDVRALMSMDLLDESQFVPMLGIAMGSFLILLLVGRLLAISTRGVRKRMPAWLPPRISVALSLGVVALISWNLGNGVIGRGLLSAADRSLQEIDARIDPELPVPSNPLRPGSAASLIAWESLGRQGRRFVAGGFTKEKITDFHGGAPAKDPIRVYAGLNSAENMDARAAMVLEEMLRVGAFDREYLVVATPTGTGWIDAAAVDPFEIIHQGDTAIVGMQYSYLLSPLATLVEPDRAPKSARALAGLVYDHWRRMPPDSRPKLYLHGLSLGSYGSEQALSLLALINHPIDGALWSGPTFNNPLWKVLTRKRNPDTPAWLPRIGTGETVRFTAQENALVWPGAEWGRSRFVYLQYASDPITFFEFESAYRPPGWMVGQRGPDVSDKFQWYPLVTMFQLAVDMAIGTEVPPGFGHLFATEHYIDAWLDLMEPVGWQDDDTDRLKALFH